jgi:hypothetical protein
MDAETVELFEANKRVVTAHKDAAYSTALHKNLMSLAVKTILLYDNHTFTEEDFQEFRVPFRKICNLVSARCVKACRDHYGSR